MKNFAYPALLVCGGLLGFLCFFIRQDEFVHIAFLYGLSFICYLYGGHRDWPDGSLMTQYNLLLKLILIFAFPRASDDIYRFFWDGQCWLQGISAYQYKPAELVQLELQEFEKIYRKLNSKEYFSVYPPWLQFIFTACAFISFKSVFIFSICWKSILLIADQLTIKYLKRLNVQTPKAVYWYAWNPLVLYEVFGNGHPEGLMICFLTMTFYYLQSNFIKKSAISLSLATGIKLLPAFLFPFFISYLGIKKSLQYLVISGFLILLFLVPVWPYLSQFLSSLRLYFKTFEFNGSIYELWKAVDYLRFGYNNIEHIGQWMAVCFIAVIIFLVVVQKKYHFQDLIKSCFLAWLAYLFLSTTVHPWYILPVLVLGLFSGYFFPVVWSGMVILSYSGYDDNLSLGSKYVLIALEYGVLLIFMVWELAQKYHQSRPTYPAS
ncbi:MAG: hypothetical protein SH818_11165 [Saprospiraceae bacterium]|nr:hypothetical protein [Saprospiraceae bacterium]